jgi:hypothetical protein
MRTYKPQGLLSQQVWQVKVPSLLKAIGAKNESKFAADGESGMKAENFLRRPYTNKNVPDIFTFTSFLLHKTVTSNAYLPPQRYICYVTVWKHVVTVFTVFFLIGNGYRSQM